MEKWLVLGLLLLTFVLFAWGRWRYDVIALFSLLAVTLFGTLQAEEAFAGFGHPAVITVAAILVVSKGLMNSGLIEVFGGVLGKAGNRLVIQIFLLTAIVAFFSAFMNNIGALAIVMPIAIHVAQRHKLALSRILMPLAFGSLLGGMMTVIGTPPNIIISSFRQEVKGAPFLMFDFLPVGIGITIVGLIFLALFGWRLLPQRKGELSLDATFELEDYLTEVKVMRGSPLIQQAVKEINKFTEGDILIVGILRKGQKIPAPGPHEVLKEGDILILRANSLDIQQFIDGTKVKLVPHAKIKEKEFVSDNIHLLEAVIHKNSKMEGKTVKDLHLRWKHGVNLLGISRKGERLTERLGDITFQAGDVLLLQGPQKSIQDVINEYTCLPLPERGIRLGKPKRLLLTVSIFATSILLATLGILHVAVAFTLAALVMVIANVVTLREAYKAIDWPIIILLGAMLPLGTALEKTGGAEWLAGSLVQLIHGASPVFYLIMIFLLAALMSNIINNAATAVLMAPIAIQLAYGLQLSADPFLMAVALGSSTAFMTPIAHQSNLLVMAPGGYSFTDYFRLGLPLTILVTLVAIPLLLWMWPL